jgi:hypothetical protein
MSSGESGSNAHADQNEGLVVQPQPAKMHAEVVDAGGITP